LFAYIHAAVRRRGVQNFQPQPDAAVVPWRGWLRLLFGMLSVAAEVPSPSKTRVEIDLKPRRYQEAPDNLDVVVIDIRGASWWKFTQRAASGSL